MAEPVRQERARFVNRNTGQDVYIYDKELGGYYCVLCGPKRKTLYGISEIIDHRWNQHTDFYYEDGETKSRIAPGSEILENVISV